MSTTPDPPQTYLDFVFRFPALGEAWERCARAGTEGPLDAKQVRLIKLAVAVGALRKGAVRASARKAAAMGIGQKELDQVIALAAGTLGFPGTVAVYSWIESALAEKK